MKSLFTPWRYPYLVSEKPSAGGCIFCDALGGGDDATSLVAFRADHNFVILNRYPYTNGHVMIVPNAHVASPAASTPIQRAEMMDLASACETILRQRFRAEGVNMGMNLGRAAGAGIDAHYHLHVLPRWEGDTNFMAATADTRIIPEDLSETRRRFSAALQESLGAPRRNDV